MFFGTGLNFKPENGETVF